MNSRFPKNEKLKSAKQIDALFSEGKSISNFPLKGIYLPQPFFENHKVAFAVPKKNFKNATDRNKIKRQLRDVYRLHKHLLSPNNGKNFALLFLYISKEKPHYTQLEISMKGLLKLLKDEVSK